MSKRIKTIVLVGLLATFLWGCGSEADFPTAMPFYAPTKTSTPAPTATVPVVCTTNSGKPARGVILNYATKWDDADKLANSTSRVSLAPQIATLQGIRRDLEAESFMGCGQDVQRTLSAMMNSEIEMLLAFLRQDGDRAVSLWRQDRDTKFYSFTASMAVMNNEPLPPTPTPFPPPPPTSTPYVYIAPTVIPTATKPPVPCEKSAFSVPGSCP